MRRIAAAAIVAIAIAAVFGVKLRELTRDGRRPRIVVDVVDDAGNPVDAVDLLPAVPEEARGEFQTTPRSLGKGRYEHVVEGTHGAWSLGLIASGFRPAEVHGLHPASGKPERVTARLSPGARAYVFVAADRYTAAGARAIAAVGDSKLVLIPYDASGEQPLATGVAADAKSAADSLFGTVDPRHVARDAFRAVYPGENFLAKSFVLDRTGTASIEIAGLAPGRYLPCVRFGAKGDENAIGTPIDLVEGRETRTRITLPGTGGATIRGTIRGNGRDPVEIIVDDENGPLTDRRAITLPARGGSYSIDGLRPGMHHIAIGATIRRSFDLAAGATGVADATIPQDR